MVLARTRFAANGGLCSTCNQRATCILLATRGPALLCELFDSYVLPPRRLAKVEPDRPEAAATRDPAAKEPSPLKGLCVNCAQRSTCTYPKHPQGIWRCEEYE
ncbi:MAG: hypothetical protein ACYS0G_00145 [Planctomycetota bacterium]|jgi:hypothetical protein